MNYKWYTDKSFLVILLLLDLCGYAGGINGISSPYIVRTFELNQAGVAAMFAWFSLGFLGTLFATKLSDKIGRRQLVLFSLVILWLAAFLSIWVADYFFFVVLQIFVHFSIGTIFWTTTVMITEMVPASQRAKCQSIATIVAAFGGGGVVLLMIPFADTSLTWRWHWIVVSASFVVVVPGVWLVLKESDHFLTQEITLHSDERGSWRALFKAQQTVPMLIASFLSIVAISAGATYTFYYLITIRGMNQATASLITLGAGGIGIWGTFLGALISNRYGRVVSLMLTTVAWTLFMIWFYLIDGAGMPYVIAVFLAVLAMTITIQAREVAFRTLITELYPTRLRSTFSGVLAFALAVAVTISHFLATLLIDLTGRMDLSVIILVVLIIPATVIYLFVPDTKGIELDNQSLYDRGVKPIDTVLLWLKGVRQ